MKTASRQKELHSYRHRQFISILLCFNRFQVAKLSNKPVGKRNIKL